MSPKNAVLESSVDGRVDAAAIGAPVRPQVNLLPPEIRSRRALGRVKLRLGLVIGLVVLVVALGYVYAAFTESKAATELAAEQDEAQSLLDEQAQYAEAPRLKSRIGEIESARAYGMSTEVLWKDFLAAIQAVVPAGVTIHTLTIDVPSPGMSSLTPANPLAASSIGTISFTGQSTTIPNVGAWLDALETIPGFSDPAFSTLAAIAVNGLTVYDVSSTVQVDETIFARRFEQTEAE